jgi:peptidoglycan/xylan/chitin deacetylase (PgdA/CDA1 family)
VASLGQAAVDYRQLSPYELRRDLLRARETLEKFNGTCANLFRPPGGGFDIEVLAAARSLGCRLVLWDVESWDWKLESPAAIVDRVLGIIRPGSLIHFHADDSYPVVAELITEMVNELWRAGYTIRPLSAVLGPAPAVNRP